MSATPRATRFYVLQLDAPNGDLTAVEKVPIPGIASRDLDADGGEPRPRVLYVGTRGEPQIAAGFAIDPATGSSSISARSARRQHGLHRDRPQRPLSPGASYPGHKVTVNPIEAGKVQPPQQMLGHIPTRTRSWPTRRTATCWCRPSATTRQPVPLRRRNRQALADRPAGRRGARTRPARATSPFIPAASSSTSSASSTARLVFDYDAGPGTHAEAERQRAAGRLPGQAGPPICTSRPTASSSTARAHLEHAGRLQDRCRRTAP